MFRGRIVSDQVFPYPQPLTEEQASECEQMVDATEKFFTEVNDAAANDATSVVNEKAMQGLRDLGAFGMVVKPEYGGVGLTGTQYARIVEIVGKYDLGIAVMLGAHQSIGYKGILLFGTDEQKAKYLPRLTSGEAFASFALTEPSCGSDANSIKTRAEPTPDGRHFVLNGAKIWITNAGWSEIFTVFAQTPVKDEATGETRDKVTAFIVERAFGGVTAGPAEKKMGIKCSNTCELFLENVKVPAENVLDGVGNGFKVAMAILNNGRFGMIAGMSGTAKWCAHKAIEHAAQRVQFGKKLCEYGHVQEKLARMAMLQYATESMAFAVSANMDQGSDDYQLEAAIGKVYGSETAWYCCDEAIQILGGMGFMVETGLERVLRDLRIFRIFEGTNDILRLFVVLTGIGSAGRELKEGGLMTQTSAYLSRFGLRSGGPDASGLVHADLRASGALLSDAIARFGSTVGTLTINYKRAIIDQQYMLIRLADAAMEIYAMACSLSRCTLAIECGRPSAAYETRLVNTFCRMAHERALASLAVAGASGTPDLVADIASLSETIVGRGDLPHTGALGF